MVMESVTSSKRPLHSGQLARLAGVSADSLRYYERVGVLPAPERSAGGYRVYPPGSLERVRLVRRALAFGFSLAELAHIFGVRERGGIPCRQARALGKPKLAEVERRLRELESLRSQLRKLLRHWDRRLARKPRGQRAELLASLPEPPLLLTKTPLKRKRGYRIT
jgi:MerR family transcriptional regulator, copper efflux regulator